MGIFSRLLEFAGIQKAEYDFIPSLEGPWTPNNMLEAATELFVPSSSPDMVAVEGDGDLLITAGKELYRVAAGIPSLVRAFPGTLTTVFPDSDGSLWLGCEGHGLLQVDRAGTEIQRKTEVAGVQLRCITSLVRHHDGTLLIAMGSRQNGAEDWIHDLMGGARSGCIVALSTSGERVIATDLGWPSGLALDHKGNVCVALAWDHCLQRYGLNGRLLDRPIPNFPGYPAHVSRASDGHHWMALFGMRTQLIDFILREDEFRADMMRNVDPRYWIRPTLLAEDSYMEPLQGGSIKKLGITKAWAPPRSYGLVVELDENFLPLRSFHSRVGGRHHGITSAVRSGNQLLAVAKGPGILLSIELEGK